MRINRNVALGLALVALASSAVAQFDGPAPLAWRWSASSQVSPTGVPVVNGDTIYVAVGQRMYALDRTSGNLKWRYPAIEPIAGWFRSAPLLINNTLIAAADNKTIYAADATTGENKWSYISPVPIIRQPVAADKFVVFALSDNSIMAVDSETGQAAWQTPLRVHEGLLGQLGAYQNNVIFFNNSFQMRSVSVSTQKNNWTARFSQLGPDATPVVQGDLVYVNSGPYVAALNAASGAGRWQGNSNDQLAFAPAVSGDAILSVSNDGKIYFFNTNGQPITFRDTGPDGKAVSRRTIDLNSQPSVRPTVVGSKFLVPTRNGALNLIDPKTGTILWSYLVRPVGGVAPANSNSGNADPGGNGNQAVDRILAIPASGPAILAGQTLLVLASDASLLAFDKESGVDLTGPAVTMTWPSPGDIVSGQPPLELIFKIEDDASGIDTKTLKIMADNTELEHTFGRDGIARVTFSALGKNKPMTDGRKNIIVTVRDWLGNETKETYALIIDNTMRPRSRPTSGGSNDRGGNLGGGIGGGLGGRGGGLR